MAKLLGGKMSEFETGYKPEKKDIEFEHKTTEERAPKDYKKIYDQEKEANPSEASEKIRAKTEKAYHQAYLKTSLKRAESIFKENSDAKNPEGNSIADQINGLNNLNDKDLMKMKYQNLPILKKDLATWSMHLNDTKDQLTTDEEKKQVDAIIKKIDENFTKLEEIEDKYNRVKNEQKNNTLWNRTVNWLGKLFSPKPKKQIKVEPTVDQTKVQEPEPKPKSTISHPDTTYMPEEEVNKKLGIEPIKKEQQKEKAPEKATVTSIRKESATKKESAVPGFFRYYKEINVLFDIMDGLYKQADDLDENHQTELARSARKYAEQIDNVLKPLGDREKSVFFKEIDPEEINKESSRIIGFITNNSLLFGEIDRLYNMHLAKNKPEQKAA